MKIKHEITLHFWMSDWSSSLSFVVSGSSLGGIVRRRLVGDGLPLLLANRPVFADPRRNPEGNRNPERAGAKRKQAKSNNMSYEPTPLSSLIEL